MFWHGYLKSVVSSSAVLVYSSVEYAGTFRSRFEAAHRILVRLGPRVHCL